MGALVRGFSVRGLPRSYLVLPVYTGDRTERERAPRTSAPAHLRTSGPADRYCYLTCMSGPIVIVGRASSPSLASYVALMVKVMSVTSAE